MSGEKVGTWRLAEPGDPTAISWDQANRILEEYKQKAEDVAPEAGAELTAQHPGLSIKYVDAEPESDPPATVEALIKALQYVQDRHNDRHFEVQRVEKALDQHRRIDAILRRASDQAGEARLRALRSKISEAARKLEPSADPTAQVVIERMIEEALSVQGKDLEWALEPKNQRDQAGRWRRQ